MAASKPFQCFDVVQIDLLGIHDVSEDFGHLVLAQNMNRWIRRAVGKMAKIVCCHILKQILRVKGCQLHMLGQLCFLQKLLKPIE